MAVIETETIEVEAQKALVLEDEAAANVKAAAAQVHYDLTNQKRPKIEQNKSEIRHYHESGVSRVSGAKRSKQPSEWSTAGRTSERMSGPF